MMHMKELLLKRPAAFVRYLAACFLPVATDLMSAWAFSRLIGAVELASMDYFWQNLLLAVLVGVAGIALFIVSRFMRIGFMRDTILDVRMKAFDKILGLSSTQFNAKSRELYISNLVNDVNLFEQDFFLKLLNVIYSGGRYIFGLAIIFFLDPLFALLTAAASFVLYFITTRFERRTVKLKESISDGNEELTVQFANTFNGLEVLKLNRVEDKFLERSLQAMDRIERRKLYFSVYTEGQRGLGGFLSNLIFVGMLIYLLRLGFSGLSLTSLALLLQLSAGCVMPIGYVIPLFNDLKAAIKIYHKITDPLATGKEKSTALVPCTFDSCIEMKDLSVRYDERTVLRELNLRIEKGCKYLLRGASGAGKSTLLKVLAGMEENYTGILSLDGVSYTQIDQHSFNQRSACIYQDVFLFEDSLRNNISLFQSAPDSELLAVARQAGLNELLSEGSASLDRQLAENGRDLSGGQRQRISIARALYKGADIIFVDEGTASLNEELGASVEQTLLNLDATVIAISHRYYPGVTERYDFILELVNGRVVQYSSAEYFEKEAV